MNWKRHFREIILDRGYDYFLDGCVDDLETNNDGYSATVCGTEDYHVEIELYNGRISESKPRQDKKETQKIIELLDSTSPEQLRAFFLEQIQENEDLLQTFKLRFAEKVSESDVRRFKRIIHQMFSTYAYNHKQEYDYNDYSHDYDGDEDYGEDSELVDEIRDFIDKYIEKMLEKQEYL